MADFSNDLITDRTPTGSDGEPVGIDEKESNSDGALSGSVYGLLVRPIGGPFPMYLADPPSTSSISVDQTIVKKRMDLSGTTNINYIGYAPLGTPEGSALWRINKITFLGGEPEISEWTTSSFAVWDNRTTESYQ